MQSINQVILNAIKSMFDKYKDDFIADKTYVGKVINVSGNKKYTVLYNDAEREIRTKNEVNLSIGDTVHIVYPLGKENNKYMVEDVISSEESFSGVKTVDGQTGDIVLSNTYYDENRLETYMERSIFKLCKDLSEECYSSALKSWQERMNKKRMSAIKCHENGWDTIIIEEFKPNEDDENPIIQTITLDCGRPQIMFFDGKIFEEWIKEENFSLSYSKYIDLKPTYEEYVSQELRNS